MADSIPWIGSTALRARLGPRAAISALEHFLRSGEVVVVPQRSIVALGTGHLVTMPAGAQAVAGIKLVTIQPTNPDRGLPLIHSVYVLIEAETLAPIVTIDGGELTSLRTSSVSGLATQYLARDDASRLVVFGAGVQAEAHVHAMRAIRPLQHVTVVGRSERADALVTRLRAQTGLSVARGQPPDVRDADIVCTCTSASEPVFDRRDLAPGTHVNAIGSYQPQTREVDSATVTGAAVFLDERDAVLAEAGDLRIPIEAREFDAVAIAGDLRALVNGTAGRRTPTEITLFKSVGAAWQDLAVARAAWAEPTVDD